MRFGFLLTSILVVVSTFPAYADPPPKRFEVHSFGASPLPTLHPTFVLRTPSAKAQAWKDMLSLGAALMRG